jgi:hypothetical protein
MKTAWATRSATRAAARRERRRLAAELASYQTPSQRLDLELILAQYPQQDTEEITKILRMQDAARDFAA